MERRSAFGSPRGSVHPASAPKGLCSVEEDNGAGELNAGEENLGELVVTRGDGPEMLELVEETLNEIAFAVEGEISCARGFSVRFGGSSAAYRVSAISGVADVNSAVRSTAYIR